MKVFHRRSQTHFDVPDDIFRKGGGDAVTKWIDDLLEVEAARTRAAEEAKKAELAKLHEEALKKDQADKAAVIPEVDRYKQMVERQRETIQDLNEKLLSAQRRALSDMDTIISLRARLEPTGEDLAQQKAEKAKVEKKLSRNRVIFDAIREGNAQLEDLEHALEIVPGASRLSSESSISPECSGGDDQGAEGQGLPVSIFQEE